MEDRQIYTGPKILRGRKEIAQFVRLSPANVDKLLDRGIIPHWRSGNGPGHTIFTTTDLVLEAMEKFAKQRQDVKQNTRGVTARIQANKSGNRAG